MTNCDVPELGVCDYCRLCGDCVTCKAHCHCEGKDEQEEGSHCD